MFNKTGIKLWILVIIILLIISGFIHSQRTGKVNLPEKILIKTSTETFTADYYFALYDDKIYYKRNQDVANNEIIYNKIQNQDPKLFNEWKLLEPSGIPDSNNNDGMPGLPNSSKKGKSKNFKVPKKIIEISADNSILIALSDENQFYYCYLCDGSKFHRIKGWSDKWGGPADELYYSEKFKKWEAGCRSEKVEWFEDPDGYKRSYGGFGLSTLYALSKDGRDIYFVDNGMPQSFHDIIASPINGEFIADNMSVSGDTIFLIDKYGNTYTRVADFDTIGDDVMLYKYSYKSYPLPKNNDGRSFEATQFGKEFTNIAVKLPCEPWRKQEMILLKGKAKITNKITILTTDKGNAGRELRVIGLDENGNSGYYYKNIFEEEWKFKTYEIEINEEELLEVDYDQIDLGESVRKNFKGKIKFFENLQVDANLLDFTSKYAPSTLDPATIQFTIDDETIEIKLHMVNTWKAIYNPAEYPYHEPRTFFGTLEIPEGINTINKKINRIMKRLHNRYDKKEFRFVVESGRDYVRVHKKVGSKQMFVMNFVRENIKLKDIEKRSFLNPYIEEKNGFGVRASNENLIINDIDIISFNDHKKINDLKEKLELNINTYNELKKLRKIARNRTADVLARVFGFRIIQGFLLATGTIVIPESTHFYKHIGILFKIQSIQMTRLYCQTMEDYNSSMLILKQRINLYSNKIEEIKNEEITILEEKYKINNKKRLTILLE